MLQKRATEALERHFDAVAEPVADASALFDTLGVVFFEPTFVGIGRGARQARAMQQTIEERELTVDVRLHHAGQVELHETRLRDPCAMAQQAKPRTVSNDAPDRVRLIQVLLHSRMRASALLCALVEIIVAANAVDRGSSGLRACKI